MRRNRDRGIVPMFDDDMRECEGKTFYSMETYAQGHPAVYTSESWLGLGWQIFKRRFWHLVKDRRWGD